MKIKQCFVSKIIVIIAIFLFSAFLFSCKNKEDEEKMARLKSLKEEIIDSMPMELKEDGPKLVFITSKDDVSVSYKSSIDNIISTGGQVNFPETDTFVTIEITLSVELKKETYKETLSQIIIVRSAKNNDDNGENHNDNPDDLLERKLDEIEMDIRGTFSGVVSSDVILVSSSLYNSSIRYESSNSDILSNTGKVKEDVKNEEITLLFYITINDIEYGPYSIKVTINTYVPVNDNEYYSDIDNTLNGDKLKQSLRKLITDTQTKITSYDDLKTLTVKTDADPDIPGNIILFYSRVSVSGKWDSGKTWNREHVWPRSKSWFQYDGAGSDIHHLRPTNPSINSSRGNKAYSTTTDSTFYAPDDVVKGDIARIVFYLLTRYPESDGYPITNVAKSMKMLLEWNKLDPVDELEIHRNEECFKIQGNRNPFIDFSEYADMIWGTLDLNIHEPFDTYVKVNFVVISEIKRRDYL